MSQYPFFCDFNIYGEWRHRTETRFLRVLPSFYAESDSADNSYQWKSPYKIHTKLSYVRVTDSTSGKVFFYSINTKYFISNAAQKMSD